LIARRSPQRDEPGPGPPRRADTLPRVIESAGDAADDAAKARRKERAFTSEASPEALDLARSVSLGVVAGGEGPVMHVMAKLGLEIASSDYPRYLRGSRLGRRSLDRPIGALAASPILVGGHHGPALSLTVP
jgi:hypothetical protein